MAQDEEKVPADAPAEENVEVPAPGAEAAAEEAAPAEEGVEAPKPADEAPAE